MLRLIPFAVFLSGVLPTVALAQDNQVDAKCALKVVSRSQNDLAAIQLRPGEKATGKDPLISFEILESGSVINARLERSSGVTAIDRSAMDEIRSTRYNRRPGCGVIESKASVTIDFR
jgi:TonB family protein